MMRFVKNLLSHFQKARSLAKRGTSRQRSCFRPQLESLERREVPTVTPHGGVVLPNVEVQGLYYGSDWINNSTYYQQAGRLDGFLNNVVHSSYMDMLSNAGYGVGRGSFDQGWIDGSNINKSYYVDDTQIQGALVSNINSGHLAVPDANRLYVVFVEDNVAVNLTGQGNSQNSFLGYHGAFGAWLSLPSVNPWGPTFSDIHYAVVTYPGGSIGNASRSWLGAMDTMTLSASHEIAEAVTDPNINYKAEGWYDDNLNSENGDISNAQTVYLNGYAVQRIPDKNDQAMTPVGATSLGTNNFFLKNDGTLYLQSSGLLGPTVTYLSSNIASLSDQSIDNFGQAMVDVVTTGGYAYEYHVGRGWTYLSSGVKDAKAGQGVSYVLDNNGQAWEYKDWGQGANGNSATWTQIDSNVTAIDAGTDRYGINMMTEVWLGYGYEHSDSTGWHYIDSGVKSVSAGQNGIMDYLTTAGNAYFFNESIGGKTYLGSGVSAVTAGTDLNGNWMIDLLFSNGNLWEYRQPGGWTQLTSSVVSIGKAHSGVVDMVFAWGNTSYAYSPAGWNYLSTGTQTAA
jgi:hypothetical protein